MAELTSNPPIFLVGCQRSGTTMLRLVLDSHSRISCGPETRFLPDLRRIVDEQRDWPRLARFGWLAAAAGSGFSAVMPAEAATNSASAPDPPSRALAWP